MDWRKRMLLVFITLLIVCLLSTILVSYYILSQKIADRSLADNENVMMQVRTQIETAYSEIELFSKMICTDEEINRLLVIDPAQSISEQTNTRYSVMEKLRTYAYLCQYVDTFVIERPDGEIFTSVRGYEEDYRVLLKQPWYTDFVNAQRNGAFSAPHTFFTPYGSTFVDGLSYILRYKNTLESRDGYTHLIAEVRWSYFEKLLGSLDGRHASLVLLNADHRAIVGDTPPQAAQDELFAQGYAEDGPYLMSVVTMEKPNWTLMLTLDRSALNKDVFNELLRYALIEIAVFSALMVAAVLFIYKTSKPIERLTSAMQAISKGRLDTRVTLHTGDEFEILANGVNNMAAHLSEYIDKVLKVEEEKRRMQSELLLSQIRPHFIYNTLNSVTYLIEEGRGESAIRMTHSLIALLQDTVLFCDTDSLNDVYAEICIQVHYLDIQSVRYPDCFRFESNVASGLDDCMIPRMMLQPIVENALLHGIVPANRLCVLKLDVTKAKDRLRIVVSDNGVGMDQEQLEECMQRHQGSGLRNIALVNIADRLDLIYGKGNNSLHIASAPGEGTTVELLLPLVHGKEATYGRANRMVDAG